MKHKHRREPYITEEEFNRIVIQRDTAQPQADSKGGSGVDETVEAELGKQYPQADADPLPLDEAEEADHGRLRIDRDQEKIQEETSDEESERSSTWPDASDIPA